MDVRKRLAEIEAKLADADNPDVGMSYGEQMKLMDERDALRKLAVGATSDTERVEQFRTMPPDGFTIHAGATSGPLSLKSVETGWVVTHDKGENRVVTGQGKTVGRYRTLDAALAHATTGEQQTESPADKPTATTQVATASTKPTTAAASDKQQQYAASVQKRHLSQIQQRIDVAAGRVEHQRKAGRDTTEAEADLAKWQRWKDAVSGVTNARRILDAEHLDFSKLSDNTADIYAGKLGIKVPGGAA